MAKGRKVRASRAAQGYVEFSHFPPAVHFDLIRKQAVVIPAEPLFRSDRKSGPAGMPRPISYAVFCLKKKKPLASEPTDARITVASAEFGLGLRSSSEYSV